jgi:hypothetical protein
MRMNERDPENKQSQAPARFVEAFREIHKDRLFIPPSVDRAVLSKARRHFRRFSRSGARLRPWGRWAVLAASLALAVWLVHTRTAIKKTTTASSEIVPGDIDGNGVVDILDAFTLTRLMKHDPSRAQRWDLNGDGVTDDRDIELVALLAVNLEEKTL